jgi:hypothetical protein
MRAAMIRSFAFAVLLGATASAAFAQGRIDTVARGSYVCEVPDESGVSPGKVQEDRAFKIETGSRYSSPRGSGTYLRRGDIVTMTSGPHKGEKYEVAHAGYLRLLTADGKPTRLRCVIRARS